MPKKPLVRTLVSSQHVKVSETVFKISWLDFWHFFWAPRKKLSSRNCILIVSEILRLFINILIPHDKYSLSVKVSGYCNQFKCNFLEIRKFFQNFFLHFRNLYEILHTLKQKIRLRGDLFLILQTAKSGVT